MASPQVPWSSETAGDTTVESEIPQINFFLRLNIFPQNFEYGIAASNSTG